MELGENVKKDFPIFGNENLVYLDSAATSQLPSQVIDSMNDFWSNYNSNTSRGVYSIAEKATEKYEEARNVVANFIGARKEEIIFTKGATNSINILSRVILDIIPEGKNEIVLSEMEHHSNLVPWQIFCKRNGLELKFIKMKDNFTLDINDAKSKIGEKTAIVSVTHVSNILGTINPVEEIGKVCKGFGAIFIVDGAQSIPHMKIDVEKIGCDFFIFSSHKMLGPMGVGVLYGKEKLLNKLKPDSYGGGMTKFSDYENADFVNSPEKFEAGTGNICGVIGLSEAIKYLEEIGMGNIESWENGLVKYSLEKLGATKGIKIYNPGFEKSSGIISFNIEGIHPHDLASILNDYGICVRAGHGCAMPLIKKLGIDGVCRASLYLYNTAKDVDKLISALEEITGRFSDEL